VLNHELTELASHRDIVLGIYNNCLRNKESIFQLYKIVCEPIPETEWTVIEWYFNPEFSASHRSVFVHDLICEFELTTPDYRSDVFCLDAAHLLE
jgi:hypothetical protein